MSYFFKCSMSLWPNFRQCMHMCMPLLYLEQFNLLESESGSVADVIFLCLLYFPLFWLHCNIIVPSLSLEFSSAFILFGLNFNLIPTFSESLPGLKNGCLRLVTSLKIIIRHQLSLLQGKPVSFSQVCCYAAPLT